MKTIEKLNNETETQREKVAFCKSRIAEMEMQVGMIADTQVYKENFELPIDEKVSLQSLADPFIPKKE